VPTGVRNSTRDNARGTRNITASEVGTEDADVSPSAGVSQVPNHTVTHRNSVNE